MFFVSNKKSDQILNVFVCFQARPYAFTYGVKDDYSGTDFSRAEESSGQVTKGQYQVALPDGRIQVKIHF